MIPLELLTGLISTGLSFAGSIISMKTKARAEEQKLLLQRAEVQDNIYRGAREFQTKEAKWTRRTIALSACFAILIWPVIAPLFGLSVATGWTELTGGFWPFTDPKDKMVWHLVEGSVVITPLHTHTLMSIIGFYFGSSIAENARSR